MTKLFQRDGISFRYPTNWQLEMSEMEPDDGWVVSIESPATAFMTLAYRPDSIVPEQIADDAIAVLQAEYPDIDYEVATDTLARNAAIGYNFDFISVDTPVTGWLRVATALRGLVLVVCQVGEYDRELNEPVLHAICASLTTA